MTFDVDARFKHVGVIGTVTPRGPFLKLPARVLTGVLGEFVDALVVASLFLSLRDGFFVLGGRARDADDDDLPAGDLSLFLEDPLRGDATFAAHLDTMFLNDPILVWWWWWWWWWWWLWWWW
jgi:hypothetical protein